MVQEVLCYFWPSELVLLVCWFSENEVDVEALLPVCLEEEEDIRDLIYKTAAVPRSKQQVLFAIYCFFFFVVLVQLSVV